MLTVLFVLKKNVFYLDLAIVLALLKKEGFKVEILFEEVENENLIKKIKSHNPSLIGSYTEVFDLLNNNLAQTLYLLENIKKELPGTTVFLAGIHSTIYPDIINQYRFLDILFVGDMETSIVEVAGSVRQKPYSGVQGIVCRNGDEICHNPPSVPTDLSKLPFPDFAPFLRYPGAFRYGHQIPWARGCPNHCSFCFNPKIAEIAGTDFANSPRYFPVKYLIDIIKYLKENDSSFQILYVGQISNLESKQFFREFCELYKGLRIPYVIPARLDTLDEEVVQLLKESNCSKITIAIESGNERLRNQVLKKNLDDDVIYKSMKLLKKYNIRVGCNIIMGFPDETIDDAFASLEMARRIKADIINTQIFVPIKGLNITSYAIGKGYLSKDLDINSFKYKKSILDIKNKRYFENLVCLAPLYLALPLKPLLKFLLLMPSNRFFSWVKILPRVKAVLNYEMRYSSILDKFKYILYVHYYIFVRNKWPERIVVEKPVKKM